MSFFKEIIEDLELNKEIVKSFKTNKHLSKSIFSLDSELHKEVRDKLLEISNTFLDFIGIEFFVHDIIIVGSIANYNWSKYSDVDLHIVIDFNEFSPDEKNSELYRDIITEFFHAKKIIWNTSTDIKIRGFDVELYIQDIDEMPKSSGVYSILNDEWIAKPPVIKSSKDLNIDKVLSKGEEYAKHIDSLLDSSNNGMDVSDEVSELRQKISKFRKSGLERGGEFSYENLTFKLLRRNNYIGKLKNIKTSIQNKKLSLPQ